jgi:hypothetical protein
MSNDLETGTPPSVTPALVPADIEVPERESSATYPTPYTDAVLADNPVLWWRFNDAPGSTTIVDTMGFADGTELDPGATQYQQPGLITEHDEFSMGAIDNATSFVQAALPATLVPTSFTVEWWTKVIPLGGFQNALAFSTNGGDELFAANLDGTGAMGVQPGLGNVSFNTPAGTFTGTRNHYAITLSGANLTVYKNGVGIHSEVLGTPIAGNFNFMGFGAGAAVGIPGSQFGGGVDELALYATPLSQARLLAHYNAGIATIVPTVTSTTVEVLGPDANSIGAPGQGRAPTLNAALETSSPPPSTAGMTPLPLLNSPLGEPSNPVHVNEAAPQGAIGNTVPLPTPAPTLATEGPVQGSAAPRIAGVQLVPPAPPPPPAIAGQFSQPANAPQSMLPISTLRQG